MGNKSFFKRQKYRNLTKRQGNPKEDDSLDKRNTTAEKFFHNEYKEVNKIDQKLKGNINDSNRVRTDIQS